MAEVGFFLLQEAAKKLISLLWDIRTIKEHNNVIAGEIDKFVTSITDNIQLLKAKLPNTSSPWALESLQAEVNKTASYVADSLGKGYFQSLWDAKTVNTELETLRERLVHNFQVTLFITMLEVVVDGNKKMDSFQSKMLQMSALSASHSSSASTEIRKLLQPVLIGIRKQDDHIQSFIRMVRENDSQVERSSDTEKFLADVLANLETLTEEVPNGAVPAAVTERDQYLDPISCELMVDPVKCRDGRTYDRWTILHYNLTQSKPLVIACDDVDVRGRIFENFREEGVEAKFHCLRKSYREQALSLARDGHHAEAMQMLNQVLEWADEDTECEEMRQKLKKEIASVQKKGTAPDQAAPNKLVMHKPPNAKYQSDRAPYERSSATNGYNQKHPPPVDEQGCPLGCRLFIGFCLLPCSLCCIPCLCPELLGSNST